MGQNFLDDFPDHVFASQIIPLLVQHKRLGEKSGAGEAPGVSPTSTASFGVNDHTLVNECGQDDQTRAPR